MKKGAEVLLVVVLMLMLMSLPSYSGPLDDRVTLLAAQVTELQAQIVIQQTTIDNLLSRLVAVESNRALTLAPYVRVDINELNGVTGPHVIFEGMNLHVQNGMNDSRVVNGLGNFVIGYNEIPTNGDYGELLQGERSGSHNIVSGIRNRFSQNSFFGMVLGEGNSIMGAGAVAIGGDGNEATSSQGVAIGGFRNKVTGDNSVNIGGTYNETSGNGAVILGGQENIVTGDRSTITGGYLNSVSGGFSSISGGIQVEVVNDYSWAAGN